MNPDFDIKITCREGSKYDDGTYPTELSTGGYLIFTFNKGNGSIVGHGEINTWESGFRLAKDHPSLASSLVLGIMQGASYGNKDQ